VARRDRIVNDRLLRALRGEPTDRRPVWVMRQAGRYLPEYRALRERHSFEELSGSATLAAEATMQPLARFPFDAAIIFADLMSPIGALGLSVRFDPGPPIPRRGRSRRR
jgi:uroporphyrinogen decarboxylase